MAAEEQWLLAEPPQEARLLRLRRRRDSASAKPAASASGGKPGIDMFEKGAVAMFCVVTDVSVVVVVRKVVLVEVEVVVTVSGVTEVENWVTVALVLKKNVVDPAVTVVLTTRSWNTSTKTVVVVVPT